MRKQLIAVLLFMVGSLNIAAQEYKMNVSDKNGKLVIYLSNSHIKVSGYDGNELVISARGFEAPPQRAEGLKALYNTAVDNTGIGLSVIESSGEIKIDKASREDVDYTIKIPQSMSLHINETNWNGGDFNVENIAGEIEIEAKGSDIVIEKAQGPIVANTTNGDITITYASLNQEKPNAIKSVNGHVDVTIPSNAKSDIKLRAMNGEVYTNFDIAFNGGGDGTHRIGGGGKIEGKINGGGVEFQLNTINDNIYLRKAE
ncbi:MAG: DUF4097 family beta strand repeat-containing protein [Bacteroidota bacterium]